MSVVLGALLPQFRGAILAADTRLTRVVLKPDRSGVDRVDGRQDGYRKLRRLPGGWVASAGCADFLGALTPPLASLPTITPLALRHAVAAATPALSCPTRVLLLDATVPRLWFFDDSYRTESVGCEVLAPAGAGHAAVAGIADQWAGQVRTAATVSDVVRATGAAVEACARIAESVSPHMRVAIVVDGLRLELPTQRKLPGSDRALMKLFRRLP
jgi:hypothetical protein